MRCDAGVRRLGLRRLGVPALGIALVLAPASQVAGQTRTAAVLVTGDALAPELAESLEQLARERLREAGEEVIDAGTVRAAVHFALGGAEPSDEADLARLRAQLGVNHLVHVTVREVDADAPLAVAVRDLGDEASGLAFGELPRGEPDALTGILARLRPRAGGPPAGVPPAPIAEPDLVGEEARATAVMPDPAPAAASSEPTSAPIAEAGAPTPESSRVAASPTPSARVGGAPTDEVSARETLTPTPIRLGAGIELGHAGFGGSMQGDSVAATYFDSSARTIARVRLEAQLADWFSIFALGAYARVSVQCAHPPAGNTFNTHRCSSSLGADQVGVGLGAELRIPILIGPIELAPTFAVSGVVFPPLRGASAGFSTQAQLGARATWRLDPSFGLWLAAGVVADILLIEGRELGLHPTFHPTYFVGPLFGGNAGVGVELAI